jgi:hypothetical protein
VSNDPSAIIVSLLVVGLLALVLRWVWGRPRRTSAPVDAADSKELGLLSVVASGLPRQQALEYRGRLGAVNIRSSMSKRHDGTFDVLVFHGDADQARLLAED